jgi:hypothetical protein
MRLLSLGIGIGIGLLRSTFSIPIPIPIPTPKSLGLFSRFWSSREYRGIQACAAHGLLHHAHALAGAAVWRTWEFAQVIDECPLARLKSNSKRPTPATRFAPPTSDFCSMLKKRGKNRG